MKLRVAIINWQHKNAAPPKLNTHDESNKPHPIEMIIDANLPPSLASQAFLSFVLPSWKHNFQKKLILVFSYCFLHLLCLPPEKLSSVMEASQSFSWPSSALPVRALSRQKPTAPEKLQQHPPSLSHVVHPPGAYTEKNLWPPTP